MIALLASVLGASVVGSLHCAAMCGPLQALYLDPGHGRLARWHGALAHAGGRLGAYVTLGAIAGGVGAMVDLAGDLAAVQRVAMIVAGLAVISWGALALAAALGLAAPRLRPRAWRRAVCGSAAAVRRCERPCSASSARRCRAAGCTPSWWSRPAPGASPPGPRSWPRSGSAPCR